MHPEAKARIVSLVPLKWVDGVPEAASKTPIKPNARFDNYFQWAKTDEAIFASLEEMFKVCLDV